jgi:large subunit ribosomal protein L21
MYAIIKTSGNQYRVEPGTVFETNRLVGEAGEILTLADSVLMINDENGVKLGSPTVAGASVELEIVEHLRGKKVTVFKMKRRKRYRRKQGHRQELTKVLVKDIKVG